MPVRVFPLHLIVIVEIQFQQIASRQRFSFIVFRSHFRDGHPVLVHPDLFDEQIITHMLPVQDQLYAPATGGPVQTGHGCYSHGYQVAHKGAVHEIGQQNPAFVFGHPQEGLLLVQLDEIGLLGPLPGGISPAPDGTHRLSQPLEGIFATDGKDRRNIVFLGYNRCRLIRIQVHHGKAGVQNHAVGSGILPFHHERLGKDIRVLPGFRTDSQPELQIVLIVPTLVGQKGRIGPLFRLWAHIGKAYLRRRSGGKGE